MALTQDTINDLIDMLTSPVAGNELALAVQNGSVLSNYTMKRLVIAMADAKVAADIQSCILGTRALSLHDVRVMVDAFSDAVFAANFISNLAGGVSPAALAALPSIIPFVPNPITPPAAPQNISLPAGSSITTMTLQPTGLQQVQVNLPAGSAFPSTGPGAAYVVNNAGNTNMYYVWFNVIGGSNTNPTPAGFTSVEVSISPTATNAQVAAAAAAALTAIEVGLTTTSALNVVTTTVNVVLAQAATPTFSVAPGTYAGAQIVVISSATALASFYYTLDGSTPTTSSTLYAGPITVGVSETIKVLATAVGFLNSNVASAAYTITASAGVATQVVWTQQPSTAAQNVVFGTQPIITIKDAYGSTVTTGPDATALITLSVSSGPGGMLLGTVSMNAVAGVANFAGKGLNINSYGNYILVASKASTLPSGTGVIVGYSAPLNISFGLSALSLGAAGSYTILSEAGITNTPLDAGQINGSMGVSPIAHTAITGFTLTLDVSGEFSTAPHVSGDIYAADYSAPTPANLTTAINNMMTAYTTGSGLSTNQIVNIGSGNLGSLTLAPGLYSFNTGVTIPTNLTLNGGPNDVWIFQIAGTLQLAASTSILLTGGAVASNVFWLTSGAVTVFPSAAGQGIILSSTNIAMQTSATWIGQAYAQTSVTLQGNTITHS